MPNSTPLKVTILAFALASCGVGSAPPTNEIGESMTGVERQLAADGGNTALCVEYLHLCEQGLALCLDGTNAQTYASFCSGLEARCNATVEQYCRAAQVDGGAPVDAGTRGPIISAVSVVTLTPSSADISWVLDMVATGQVEFGATPSYGQTSTRESSFQYSAHLQHLSGLAQGTRYHYRVRSSSQAGVESVSADFTFSTPASADAGQSVDGGAVDAGSGSLKYPRDVQMSTVSTPSLAKPPYLVAITEPAFGTRVMRLSDQAVFGQPDVIHHYAKDPPWNFDGTLMMMDVTSHKLLDGSSYAIVGTWQDLADTRWSYTNPHIIFGFGSQVVRKDLRTGVVTVIYTHRDYWPGSGLGNQEGNLTIDDKYAAIIGKEPNGDLNVKVLDLQAGVVAASRAFPGKNNDNVDWVSMSQSGEYVVIQWRDNVTDPVESYVWKDPASVANGHTLTKKVDVSFGSHGDLGFDTGGHEVYVQVVCGGTPPYSTNDYGILMSRLDDGTKTKVLSRAGDFSCGHVSTRNYKRPGWAYSSNNTGGGSREVYAVKLDGSGTVERFAHHYSNASAGARAVPNPDGTKVLFTSNWSVDWGDLNDYVVWMP